MEDKINILKKVYLSKDIPSDLGFFNLDLLEEQETGKAPFLNSRKKMIMLFSTALSTLFVIIAFAALFPMQRNSVIDGVSGGLMHSIFAPEVSPTIIPAVNSSGEIPLKKLTPTPTSTLTPTPSNTQRKNSQEEEENSQNESYHKNTITLTPKINRDENTMEDSDSDVKGVSDNRFDEEKNDNEKEKDNRSNENSNSHKSSQDSRRD